jgi:hypothetical protein
MMLMFYQWRRHGDGLAKVLCLSAFGTWGLAVLTWGAGGADAGKPGSLGFDVAAAALLTGFAGAIVVLIRHYTHQNRDNNVQPQKSEHTLFVSPSQTSCASLTSGSLSLKRISPKRRAESGGLTSSAKPEDAYNTRHQGRPWRHAFPGEFVLTLIRIGEHITAPTN